MVWPLPLVAHDEPGAEVIAERDGTVVRRSVLPGGLRVFTEHMPGLRSATVGAWVGVGSRDEAEGHFGSTHFLEHLLFKGTERRSAMDIAAAFDSVGGEANAATGKEHTCYYARVLDSDLPMAIDVIGDMVTSATIDPEEVEVERGVILEELAMNEDDPADVVHENFAAAVLGDNPLGRPIGGTSKSISEVSRDKIWEHYKSNYRPDTMVISAAGGVDHDEVVEMVTNTLELGGWDLNGNVVPVERRSASIDLAGIPTTGSVREIYRPVEQANVIVGSVGPSATDPRRWAVTVLNAVLGGSMSSRLFQEIRERRGLAYSTYSFAAGYGGIGTFGLYAGCAPRNVEEVERLMHGELEKIAEHGITDAELERAIGQLSGGVVLGLEDSGSRMSRLGRAELVHGEFLGLAESLSRVQAVTNEDVKSLAEDLANAPRTVVRVGPSANPQQNPPADKSRPDTGVLQDACMAHTVSGYDASMTVIVERPSVKVRKTLTLDSDLVETFSADDPDSLSAAVNAILRAERERRSDAASIRQLADDLDAMYGPPDPDEVAKARAELRG